LIAYSAKVVILFKQSLLPGFPEGANRIGPVLTILEKDGLITYFIGSDNYFSHAVEDQQSRRFVLASLMENRHVRACELSEAPMLIPYRSLLRWSAQHRENGPQSFFRKSGRAKPSVMTADKSAQCAALLAKGLHPSEVARRAGIPASTLNKAIQRKAVPQVESIATDPSDKTGSTKSERSRIDAEAASGIGTACTRADERMAAAVGLAESGMTRFEAVCDVPMAGLLTGLPALCANGLLSGLGKHLRLPRGFYSALHILFILSYMALGRIRRPEGLRHIPPGEFGKIVGLDRVPEVRTLRAKIAMMARTGNPDAWMKELSRLWMENDPAEAGYLYVDGHVRVYHGDQANLPRRFVSREKLCLRGTTDYWVNDALGRPFFVVSKAVTDIVPELMTSVPQQPTQNELDQDPQLHRFVIVFDREGATHSLLSALWKQRIGALTYRKNVKDAWPESEFIEQEVSLPSGERTRMKLAMRETTISANQEELAVTEVRRLNPTGHQTAIISTARSLDNTVIASRMFSRWCQENYFGYMMQHYDIDGLIEYGAEKVSGMLLVVNPAWRALDKEINITRQTEQRLQAKLARQTIESGGDIQINSETFATLKAVQVEIARLRAQRKNTARKMTIESLPEDQRPTQLLPLNKMLSDTVKMIAYRAETALVALLRRHLKTEDEARALIRELFVSSADIAPDDAAKTLTVKIHRMANPAHDKAIAALLEDLTREEFTHPETGAKMVYTLA
jgi:DNA-binding CsgD family transcriptional regulator